MRKMHKIALNRATLPVFNGPAAGVEQAIEAVNKGFEAFKAANEERLDGIKKGFEDVVTKEKMDKINSFINNNQKALDDLNKKVARLGVGPSNDDEQTEDQKAHAVAFNKWFRKGVEGGLSDLEVKAELTTDSDPDGGFLVPEQMEGTIDRVLGTVSAVRGLARVINITTGTYKKLVSQGGSTSGWVGEKETRSETSTPTLRELTFNAMELYAEPHATQAMLDDSATNIEQWLADEVAIEFAEEEGSAFVSGTGVNQPRGILGYTNIANASYAWGKVGYIAGGAASTLPTSNAHDTFQNLVYALKRGYRTNGTWLMNDATLNLIRQIKDGNGNYMWQPSVKLGEAPTFFGYPVVSDDNMDDIGANAYPIAFADFNRAYLIVDRIGIRVLRDPFTSKPYVKFYTTKRVGGGIQNFEAIKLYKIATS